MALDQPWPAASGIVLMALAGGVLPDYLDLRSDARGVLRHRGASHGLAAAALAVAAVWVVVQSLTRLDDPRVALDPALVQPLTLAFLAGVFTHLILDACTPRGIRPLLPVFQWRLWLLPRPFRVGTGGKVDHAVGLMAIVVAAASIAQAIAPHFQ